jgi:hypothetical protein
VRVVVAGSIALFVVVLPLLVGQMRAGHDPALQAQADAVTHSRPVLVRRIHRRIIVTEIRRTDDRPAATSPVPAPAPRRASAPPPAAAPAPSPPPAPIVTRSS